jgi:hypothetical protein
MVGWMLPLDSGIGWIRDAFDSRISELWISDRSCALTSKVKISRGYLLTTCDASVVLDESKNPNTMKVSAH